MSGPSLPGPGLVPNRSSGEAMSSSASSPVAESDAPSSPASASVAPSSPLAESVDFRSASASESGDSSSSSQAAESVAASQVASSHPPSPASLPGTPASQVASSQPPSHAAPWRVSALRPPHGLRTRARWQSQRPLAAAPREPRRFLICPCCHRNQASRFCSSCGRGRCEECARGYFSTC